MVVGNRRPSATLARLALRLAVVLVFALAWPEKHEPCGGNSLMGRSWPAISRAHSNATESSIASGSPSTFGQMSTMAREIHQFLDAFSHPIIRTGSTLLVAPLDACEGVRDV
jgi:hypothetical protein